MNRLFDSFWRAALYCLHPRVIWLSLVPLALMAAVALGLAYFFWGDAVAGLREMLENFDLINRAAEWFAGWGFDGMKLWLAPALLLMLSVPVIVIVSLLLVAMLMTPAMVSLVGRKRFPLLEQKKGGSLWASLLWSAASTVVAALALVLSIPLWLIPPLVLVLPPLIWGWLTYRVMAYDALADHASEFERRALFKAHRWPLLTIGVLSGYLGAAPSLIWASGAVFLALAPVLVPLAIWIYTLVFAFSSLWFTHYALAALEELRQREASATPPHPRQDVDGWIGSGAADQRHASLARSGEPVIPTQNPV